jgi:hypothetical protein
MASKKRQTQFANVHKRQLFHWIGRDIDDRLNSRKLCASEARKEYVKYLQDDLENGLPIKCPQSPEIFNYRNSQVTLDLPIACFTEWSLTESLPHTSRYGRMALGFAKRWVIKHGGQPVTYTNNVQSGVFLKNLVSLHNCLHSLKSAPQSVKGLKPSEIDAAFRQARYLLHFVRPFAEPRKPTRQRHKRPPTPMKPRDAQRVPTPRPATRYHGPVLEFLEEREWRIVRHHKSYFVGDARGKFDSRVEFKLGTELFTLVLPDNETVKMVWRNKALRTLLLDAPVPVTVLSFQDIGTF